MEMTTLERVQVLSPELQILILSFMVIPNSTVHVDGNYTPPIGLQLNRAIRAATVKNYYTRTRFVFINSAIYADRTYVLQARPRVLGFPLCRRWTASLPVEYCSDLLGYDVRITNKATKDSEVAMLSAVMIASRRMHDEHSILALAFPERGFCMSTWSPEAPGCGSQIATPYYDQHGERGTDRLLALHAPVMLKRPLSKAESLQVYRDSDLARRCSYKEWQALLDRIVREHCAS